MELQLFKARRHVRLNLQGNRLEPETVKWKNYNSRGASREFRATLYFIAPRLLPWIPQRFRPEGFLFFSSAVTAWSRPCSGSYGVVWGAGVEGRSLAGFDDPGTAEKALDNRRDAPPAAGQSAPGSVSPPCPHLRFSSAQHLPRLGRRAAPLSLPAPSHSWISAEVLLLFLFLGSWFLIPRWGQLCPSGLLDRVAPLFSALVRIPSHPWQLDAGVVPGSGLFVTGAEGLGGTNSRWGCQKPSALFHPVTVTGINTDSLRQHGFLTAIAGFNCRFCHSPAVWPWESSILFLCPSSWSIKLV